MKRFLIISIMAWAFIMPVLLALPPVPNPVPNIAQILHPPQLMQLEAAVVAQPVLIMANQLPDYETLPYIGLTTFAGIVALISLLVTQIVKKIPQINEKAIFKILVSLAIGTLFTYFAWWSEIATFLENMVWWQVLIQGLFAGLSACGLYDLFKGFGFVKNE